MKIRMLGLKGLPGIHGGVERHVEELGAALVARGHDVTAYVRPAYTPMRLPVRGIKLQLLPTLHTKHMDATVHTLIGSIHALFTSVDVVHYHGIGPAAFAVIPRLFGKRVVVTIHSHDYKRSKWGPLARFLLRNAEKAALKLAHRTIVVSRDMAATFGHVRTLRYIPNGVGAPTRTEAGDGLAALNLEPGRYLLYAGRISPEKGPHHLLGAFAKIDTEMKLVLAGGSSHNPEFEADVARMAAADDRVVMPGYLDAAKMAELYSHAAAFVLPSEHEGLPVALLEALSYGLPCVCTSIPAAREVATADDGSSLAIFADSYAPDDLAAALRRFLDDPDAAKTIAARGPDHVARHYRWDAIAEQTERAYYEAAGELAPDEAAQPCPACHQVPKSLEYDATRSGRVARCAGCGMVFSVSPPPVEALPPAFTDDPEAYLANARDRLGRLERYSLARRPESIGGWAKNTRAEGDEAGDPEATLDLSAHGKGLLLDVGCFDGNFAAAARTLGYDVLGVEPTEEGSRRARERHGLTVHRGVFEQVEIPEAPVDVVSFIHVFEHLKDPRAALVRSWEVLRPGGYLLIELPAYDAWSRRLLGRRWRQFISDHDRFYTGPVLARLIKDAGFRILEERKVGKIMTPRLLADRLGRYYSRALSGGILAVATGLGLANKRFALNLGDIRLVVARKPLGGRPDLELDGRPEAEHLRGLR